MSLNRFATTKSAPFSSASRVVYVIFAGHTGKSIPRVRL